MCHYLSHNCFFSQRVIYYIPGDFQNSFKSKHRLNSDIYLHFGVDILAYINFNCLNCILSLNQLEKILKKEIKEQFTFENSILKIILSPLKKISSLIGIN